MLAGYFSGVSGAHYNEQRLAVISNNLANANTSAFRKSLLMIGARQENPESKSVHSSVKKRIPNSYGTQRVGVFKDYISPGGLRETSNAFDVAIPPEIRNGFFKVNKVGDSSREAFYTRNGALSVGHIDPGNPDSPSILHVAGHVALGENNQPIEVDPTLGDLTIAKDGIIYQNNESIGEIPVYRLNKSADATLQVSANLQALEQEGDSLFKVPSKYKTEFHPLRIQAGQGENERVVLQGMREGSNVNIYSELTEMMSATQGSISNQKSISQQIGSLEKLFQLVRRS